MKTVYEVTISSLAPALEQSVLFETEEAAKDFISCFKTQPTQLPNRIIKRNLYEFFKNGEIG